MNSILLDKPETVSFHDLGISNLSILFEKKEVTIEFQEYDDLEKTYKPLTILFKGVFKFISDYPSDCEFSVIGCKDAEWKKLENSKQEIEFFLELEDGQPVYSLTIGFTSVDITRSLSLLAIEFKNTYFVSSWDKKEWFEKNDLPVPAWV